MKKALVIFGSPRQNGDTAFFVDLFEKNFDDKLKDLMCLLMQKKEQVNLRRA